MSQAGKIGTDYDNLAAPNANCEIVVFSNGSTWSMTFSTLFSLSNTQILSTYNLRLANTVTPANSTANSSIVKSSIWADANNIYVATANGVVKRAALSTF